MKTFTEYTELLNNTFTKKDIIAPVESSSEASKAYAVGEKFFYNNILYEATDVIASGGIIDPGTNCEEAEDIVSQIENKTIVTDAVPTEGSTNPVQSGGVYNSLAPVYNVLGAKNLMPNNATDFTFNGITFTVNQDGSVTANGTATDLTLLFLARNYKLKNGEYILSGGVRNGAFVFVNENNGSTFIRNVVSVGNDTPFTLNYADYDNLYLGVGIENGVTVSNVTFYPMIRPASIQDDTYVPYSMTNQEMTPYVQSISNPNLLDNPWFTVNQRGLSSYAAGSSGNRYTVDRWCTTNAETSVDVASDGITITHSGSVSTNGYLLQLHDYTDEEYLFGKTLTYSCIYDENGTDKISTVTFTVPNAIPSETVELGRLEDEQNNALGSVYWIISGSNHHMYVRLYSGMNSSRKFKAVKLELGSISTLAMDTAPNYAEELLKCQRYFYRLKSVNANTNDIYTFGFATSTAQVRGIINFPTTLRTTPSIVKSGTHQVYDPESTAAQAITSFAFQGFHGNSIVILANVASGLEQGKGYAVQAVNDADAYIDFSADL